MRNPGVPFDESLLRLSQPLGVPERLAHRPEDASMALRCLDLTTLSATDTEEDVRRLCARGVRPLLYRPSERVAAVCVYPELVPTAREALGGTGVSVATVAAAFPHGQSLLRSRVAEVEHVRELGADEIDVVIRRPLALQGRWRELYDEVRAFRVAAEGCCLKTILATGELAEPAVIARAAIVCLMAGADFVKTSTGKETVNATLEAGAALCGAIRDYRQATGVSAGLKPAGGVRTTAQALDWCALVRATLGEAALGPSTFRIGASGLLDELIDALGGDD
ncbi:MAG: deoxyribose-phosphate aldolase [Fimbriimonadales bacterium]|nr:deoxyribose-phosphate aldolase [Fimbriimonadales bacterium]